MSVELIDLGTSFFTLPELNVPTGTTDATAILDLIRHWKNVDVIINDHEIVKKRFKWL